MVGAESWDVVDDDSSHLNPTGIAESFFQVTRAEASLESVLGSIDRFHRLVQLSVPVQHDDRAEDFPAADIQVWGRVGQNRRLNRGAMARTAGKHLCAAVTSATNPGLHAFGFRDGN